MLAEPEVREVVVVDNASGDGSPELLRQAFSDPRVRIVESATNRGFGPGVNLGVANSASPLVLVLNSDATLSPGSLALLADTLTGDRTVGVVAPAVYEPDGRTPQWGAFGALPRRRELVVGPWRPGSAPAAPEWVSGVALLVRRSDFESVGGFDEDFGMYFEDLDLCRRLRALGKVVRRQPAASAVHGLGKSWESKGEQWRRFQQSKIVYLKKLGASRAEIWCARVLAGVNAALARRD